MKWITRERPRIDRIACPWLVHLVLYDALYACCAGAPMRPMPLQA